MDFTDFSGAVLSVIKSIGINDVIDMIIIGLIIYAVLTILNTQRFSQLITGSIAFGLIFIVSNALGLKTLTYFIQVFLKTGIVALVVIFQPEIRNLLEQLLSSGLLRRVLPGKYSTGFKSTDEAQRAIANICDVVERMSAQHTGALIVMEKFSQLSSVKRTGTLVNGDISAELLGTIFYEGSPLHDGAVIISENRVAYAGCVLPLSQNFEISKEYGTRHRAALGLAEKTDAICIVVSEETGKIRVAQGGQIMEDYDRVKLYDKLVEEYVTPILDSEKVDKWKLLRRKNNESK